MKRVWISFAAIAAVCGVILYMVMGLRDTGNQLLEEAGALKAAVLHEDWEKGDEIGEKISKLWEENEISLIKYVGHDHSDPVSVSIARMKSCLEQRQSPELLLELSELVTHIEQMLDSEKISFVNMF